MPTTITRRRKGRGFAYLDARGNAVTDADTLARIAKLAIPPAWTDVAIAGDPAAKIQATGRDAKGRKQYRYHASFRRRAEAKKYHRLVGFCGALPSVRAAVERDLKCDCLCKRKVVAAVIALLERAHLRIGNDEYAKANGAYGATTLRDRHAKIERDTITLRYRGKSGVARTVRLTDRTLASIVAKCRALPGSRLFQYKADDRRPHPVRSKDVNAYLREASGGDFTAKDFRTWAATIGAAQLLAREASAASAASERERKRLAKQAIDTVAARLGHTPAICRGSYIHPRIVGDFVGAEKAWAAFAEALAHEKDPFAIDRLRAAEQAVAAYLA